MTQPNHVGTKSQSWKPTNSTLKYALWNSNVFDMRMKTVNLDFVLLAVYQCMTVHVIFYGNLSLVIWLIKYSVLNGKHVREFTVL